MRYFNTTGPCFPEKHYMLPAEQRLPDLSRFIDRGTYFVVHAPRQTGKTTAMKALAQRLTAEGQYAGLYFSCEVARPFSEDVGAAERAIWSALEAAARWTLPESLRPPPIDASVGSLLRNGLMEWANTCPRPLVLVFDEVDAVEGNSLKSVLSQLRDGYNRRDTAPFPHTVILCGVRDVRDYKFASGGEAPNSGSASPFNIKAKSFRMSYFTEQEIRTLYSQHTEETGQPFSPEALALVWDLTRGQPWLVNALALEIIEEMDIAPPTLITAAHVESARERLILARATHIDSLVERLHEERVRKVIEPILIGSNLPADVLDDDLMYVRDLGLVEIHPTVHIANPMYAEIIPRTLTYVLQTSIAQEMTWYEQDDGSLNMTALLEAFQEYFAQHSEAWRQVFSYQETGPHLILMAFLQRLVNGKGRIYREFATGSGRADLIIHWRGSRYVMELKVRRDTQTISQGAEQLSGYLDRLGEDEGWLVVFDPRTTLSWEEKLYDKQLTSAGGKLIHLFGA